MAKRAFSWKFFRTWVLPPVCVIGGVALGIGFMMWRGDSSSAQALPTDASSTQTSTASLETIEKSVSATGTLAAANNETVSFDASGKVLSVDVAEGDTVAEGDVLATIDTLQLTAVYESAKADYADAKAQLSNLEDEADGSDSSDAQIASAEANVTLKKEAAADAKDDLANAELVAPFDGLITAQTYSVGDAVSSGSSGGSSAGAGAGGGSTGSTTSTSGITIIGQDAWSVDVSLTASEVDLIAVGNQVTFTADDMDEFFGVVTDISALPSTTSGAATYPVTLQVTGTPEGLFEGVSVTADIIYLRKTDVLTVPTNAITTADGSSTVTVVAEDGTEETRTVTLGEASGSLTEVTDGLSEGENVKVTVFAQGGSGDSSDGDGQFPSDGQLPGGGQFPGGQFPGGGQGGGPQGGNG